MYKDDFSECETDVQLGGKVAIVTGATSGLGLEVAKNLAKRQARVIITGRDPTRLKSARNDIVKASGNDNVVTRQMDFESLASIRNFTSETLKIEPRLDILINNIGAIGLRDKLTEDGLHTMMQVNYFGTFLLTYLLFPLLKVSAPSRIVNVASIALILGHIDTDHWNDVRKFSSFGYYSNAKLAEVLFTVEMDKIIKGSGVKVYSMDPGLMKSEFFKNLDNKYMSKILNSALFILGREVHRTATMPVFLAVDPRVENYSGKHFRDCMEFYSSWYANDTNLRERLWRETKRLVRITPYEDWDLKQILA